MIELGDKTAYYMLLIYTVMMSLATILWKPLTDIVFIIMLINIVIMYINEKPFKFDLFILLLIAFFLYSMLTILWSVNRSYAVSTNYSIAQRVGLGICVYGIIDSKQRMETLIRCFIIGGIFVFAYMMKRYGIGGMLDFISSENGARLGEDITSANYIGGSFAFAAMASWYFIVRKKWRFFNLIIFAIFFFFILASGSRTYFFGLIAGMVVCSYYSSESVKIVNVIFAIALLIIGYLLIKKFSIMPGVISRFDEALSIVFKGQEIRGSARSRLEFAEYGLGKIIQNPIFGYGAGQFRYYMGNEKGMAYSSHNNYIEVLFSYGIIGAGIWYGMYAYSLKKIWNPITQPDNSAIIGFLIMRIVSDITSHSVSTSMPYLFLALAFACVRVDERNKHQDFSIMPEGKEYVKKSYIRTDSPYR